MGIEWLVLVGIFLLTALTTYGIFVNASDAHREAQLDATLEPITSSVLAGRLDEDLAGGRAVSEAEVLESLVAQELANAEAAQSRGLEREAEVHRNIAANVRSHLQLIERKAENG